MLKTLLRKITTFFFCQSLIIVTAISLPVGNAHEVKSSYYLISTQATEKCVFTEVNNIPNKERCLSLCNKDDGCTDAIYDTGSCLLKINPKQQRVNGKAVEIMKGENIALFKKLGRNFDFKSRTFQGIPQGKECESQSEDDQIVARPESCKEIYQANKLATNGNYSIWPNGVEAQKQNVYCHMTKIPGCGEGGWTLAMKMDGNKHTFLYDSTKWAKKEAYNPASALSGLDLTEMVSPAYWTTSLTKLCLGMKKQNETNWILVQVAPAQSLHGLIASNKFTSTHLGRNKWKSLLRDSYLQSGCMKEGFNAFINAQKVRIGMVAGPGCNTPGSSLIGFGTTTYVSTGNFKSSSFGSNRGVHSFGYILIQ